jgi:hypothetical protein
MIGAAAGSMDEKNGRKKTGLTPGFLYSKSSD